ncbi:hypothetical protein DV735_g5685, partial [Chaetothyriales sp. CBS 134920]
MGVAKVLVVGAIAGHFAKAFDKINRLQAKQNFSLCLAVGDVFGEAAGSEGGSDGDELDGLLAGSITIKVPTYFSVGSRPLPEKVREKLESSDEVCPNLVWIGRKGTFTTSEGVRIVALGGRLAASDSDAAPTIGKFDPVFLQSDARALHGAHSAHILLTNQWPANITRISNIDVPEAIQGGSEGVQCIANLNLALKPWYHFSSSPAASWEREPFKQPDEYGSMGDQKITRFKSAAGANAPNKEWMTAFSLDTEHPPAAPQSTEAPFLKGASPPRKRAAPQDYEDGHSGHGHGGRRGRQAKRKRHYDPSDCFMCVTQPGFRSHLVASIGDESMVTALRGPLPLPDTFPELSFSGHAMIIPHYHAADEVAHGKRPQQEIDKEFAEMTRFRKALNNMVGSKSNGRLGTVCTEVNRTGIRHFHWQIIAMEAAKIRKGLVEAAFKVLAEKHQYPPFEECNPDQVLKQRNDFCRIWLWTPSNAADRAEQASNGQQTDEGTTKSLFLPVPTSLERFYLWYPREVCAGLLQLEDRTNWMSTLLPDEKEEEKAEERDAEGLKQDFADFDFAME